MAEIHVQTKKHNTSNTLWIWIVLALVILGALIYYFMTRNKTANDTTPANTTGRLQGPSANPLSIESILEQQSTVMYLC